MKNRAIRLGLSAAVAAFAFVPAAPAHAWSCQDEVAQVACFVAGTACGVVNKVDPICVIG
jgi:hypothetical protein